MILIKTRTFVCICSIFVRVLHHFVFGYFYRKQWKLPLIIKTQIVQDAIILFKSRLRKVVFSRLRKQVVSQKGKWGLVCTVPGLQHSTIERVRSLLQNSLQWKNALTERTSRFCSRDVFLKRKINCISVIYAIIHPSG